MFCKMQMMLWETRAAVMGFAGTINLVSVPAGGGDVLEGVTFMLYLLFNDAASLKWEKGLQLFTRVTLLKVGT